MKHPRCDGGYWWRTLFIVAGLLLLLPSEEMQAQSSQTFTVVARNAPLDQALEQVAGATGVNIIYDTRLVQNIEVYCVQRDAPPEELLRCVLSGTGLDYYQTSSGTYVLIESVREAPHYGRLAGTIVDEETGEPLPNANVYLADAGVGTAANEAGLFSFSRLEPGPYRVSVSYVGYEVKSDSIWIIPGEQTRERFGLSSRSISTEPIIVSGLQQRAPSRTLGRGEIDEHDLATGMNNAGAADVARTTAGLLGVTLQEPSADLHLQGGAAGELQLQLDGIPIRSPVTVGQLLGAFSPLAIERMTVHKAGFGAAHGSHLSGSISADHALNRSEHNTLVAQFDPLSVNARGQAHWQSDGGREATAMVAARSSLWGVVQDPTLSKLITDWHVVDPLLTPPGLQAGSVTETINHQGDVAFSDIHAATRIRLNPFHSLHASAYRGSNEVESISSSDKLGVNVPSVVRDSYHWTSRGGQIRYEGLLGQHVLGTLAMYGTWQSLGHGYQMGEEHQSEYTAPSFGRQGPYDGNRINEFGIKGGVDVNLMRLHHLSGALSITRISSQALINNDFFRQVDYATRGWQLSSFLQNDISIGPDSQLELGTRLTYIPSRETVYAEPRLAFRYDGTYEPLGDYALRFSGGLYRQYVNQFDLSSTGPTALLPFIRFWLPVDHSIAPPMAYHIAADGLIQTDGPWKINAESYFKWQPHLLAIDYPALLSPYVDGEGSLNHASFISPVRGHALGGDLQVQYSTSGLTSTASYSFTRSERQFPSRFNDRKQPTPWEQPHRLVLENSVSLTSGFATHINWRGVWGRSWAFRRAYYDYLGPQSEMLQPIPVDLTDPSQQVLSPLYQLDVGLSYERGWHDFNLQLRAKVLNVLDRQNPFDLSLRENGGGFDEFARNLPGRRPVFSVRVSY